MTEGVAFGLTVGDSQIHGHGCFATVVFHERQQIAEYIGERIALIEAARRRRAFGDQCICDVDLEWAIDGSRGGNATRYVNHSCQPNAYVVISEGRIFIHALRRIVPGEEITTDYLEELHSERVKCQCRTMRCYQMASTTTTS
jgi:uncharacterized protein